MCCYSLIIVTDIKSSIYLVISVISLCDRQISMEWCTKLTVNVDVCILEKEDNHYP